MSNVSGTAELTKSLSELIAILRNARMGIWVERLERISVAAASRDTQKAALDELRTCFGGMGGLSDIILCERNRNLPTGESERAANERLELAVDRLFEATKFLSLGRFGQALWRLHRTLMARAVAGRAARTLGP
jgi:hypothetical protein